MSALHRCPVDDCETRIAAAFLMCRWHWRRVPQALKASVWRTYRNGDGILDQAYLRAAREAITSASTSLTRVAS